MKVFRKMFAFAVTVAAIAMATSAFAATAEYNEGLVTVNDGSFDENAQMTVAVVSKGFDGTNDAGIYYIDQDEAAIIKANLVDGLAVKDELVNPAVNYEVRVAGTSMDIETINFQAVQTSKIENIEIVGAGEAVKAVGIKGEFTFNGGAKTVVLKLKDTVADKTGTVKWDLGNIAAISTPLVFGLEIQSATEMNMSGIQYDGFTVE